MGTDLLPSVQLQALLTKRGGIKQGDGFAQFEAAGHVVPQYTP